MANNGKCGKWNAQHLARGLGWFSIGLGVAQLIAPRRLGRLIGVRREHELLMRLLGLREITSGIGILTQRRPTNWVWSRVGGDVMDLALLGTSLQGGAARPSRVAAATAAVAGVTALDYFCGQELRRGQKAGDGSPHLEHSVVINRSAEELYSFWRDFQNLPRFMNHLHSVQVTSPTRSHWVAQGPAGTNVEWDAEIITDTPNEVISWRSLECADVANAGSVRFERAPGGRGTVVRVKMQYRPMGGVVGAKLAKAFGQAPEKQIKVDLYRFKQLMETGEIARTDGQPTGRPRGARSKVDTMVQTGI